VRKEAIGLLILLLIAMFLAGCGLTPPTREEALREIAPQLAPGQAAAVESTSVVKAAAIEATAIINAAGAEATAIANAGQTEIDAAAIEATAISNAAATVSANSAAETIAAPEAPTPTPAPEAPVPDAAAGEALFKQQTIGANPGCNTCHSLEPDQVIVGPSLAGIAPDAAGDAEAAGLSVEEMLTEMIVDPNAEVVQGFQPNIMPQDWGTALSDTQLSDIIAYLLTLQ